MEGTRAVSITPKGQQVFRENSAPSFAEIRFRPLDFSLGGGRLNARVMGSER